MTAHLFGLFVMACVGVAMEVAFTAFADLTAAPDWRLRGQSYVWMFPIYALAWPALLLLRPRVGHWHVLGRGALYVAFLYIVEYLSGWALRFATGACPWDYGNARWAVQGVIRLDYAPGWLAAVLLFEQVFRRLRGPAGPKTP